MKQTCHLALLLTAALLLLQAPQALLAQEGEPPPPPIHIEFHIIGFSVDTATTQQLQQVAAAAGGQYYDARNQEELEMAFGRGLGVITTGPVLTEEAEPNDRFSLADPIAASGSVTGAINPQGDVDVYQLQVKRPGELAVYIANSSPDLDVIFRVWNADRQVWVNWQGPLAMGGDTDAIADLPAPGLYFLEVRDGSDDAASDQPYRLETTFTPVVDPTEPNNRYGDATPLTIGQSIEANILPRADADWYRFHVDTRGEMHVVIDNVPQDMDVVFRVWDQEKNVLHNWMGPLRPGGPTDAIFDLPKGGDYWLEVHDGNDNLRSAQPYRLTATYVGVDEGAEPNETFGTAHPIHLGGTLQGTILPQGDADWYAFDVPGRSQLRVMVTDVSPDLDIVFRVWNSHRDVHQNWTSPLRAGGDTEGIVDFAYAGRYYLEVRDGNDSDRSTQPYTLQTVLTPTPDLLEDNNSLGRADRIFVGAPVSASILPQGDRDWYAVEVPVQAKLVIHFTGSPDNLDMAFRIWNGDAQVVLNWQNAARAGAEVLGEANIETAGVYFIEVADGSDSSSSPEPYTFTATLK